MKVESSIKENYTSTTTEPITDIGDIVKVICKWNNITLDEFKAKAGSFNKIGQDDKGQPLYEYDGRLINPIGTYLMNVYDGKDIVFEKDNNKFFGTLRVRAEQTKYMLGEFVIDIPYRIRAENEDTGEKIIIFPKESDILQKRMKGFYVVSPGWAERQKLEKEIMAKLIDLAKVNSGNEIIGTQNTLEEMKSSLKKMGIELSICNELLYLDFPRRKIRDTAGADSEYIAPPIKMEIDFMNRNIKSKGYSSHGFGTPSSWGNPCWGNRDMEIHQCLQNCSIKELVNLIISWANGYNSRDVGLGHNGRHPLAKLRDYMWYLDDNKDREETKLEIEKAKEHLEEIKQALEIDDWLNGCGEIKNFISSLEGKNETAEE